jgi:hypothetical protein
MGGKKIVMGLFWVPAFAGMTVLMTVGAWATPPTDVKLSYDVEKHMLHIEAQHPSHKLDKHFLRRVRVMVNDAEAKEFRYTRQDEPSRFVKDIEIEAKPKDKIIVEIICSEGGSKTVEFVVPSPEEKS